MGVYLYEFVTVCACVCGWGFVDSADVIVCVLPVGM